MPIYEFHCKNCDKDFEELVFSQNETPNCPHCQSQNTEKLISRPCRNRKNSGQGAEIPSMGSTSSSGGGCSGCSGGSCATCGH